MKFIRVSMKLALFILCSGVLFITFLWSQCGELSRYTTRKTGVLLDGTSFYTEDIDCHINGEYTVPCRKEAEEIYVPFSFLHKYFEVYGKTVNHDGVASFEWSHSHSKVYHPKNKYDPRGVFTTFENYNVEVRDRVKCISGEDGVPISTQWEPQGYFYPTQIAQFGLAHYSKNITEGEPRRKIIDDGEKYMEDWIVSKDASMSREYDSTSKSNVIKFATADQMSSQVWLKLDTVEDFIISIDVNLKPNSSLTLVLQNKAKSETYYLHYLPSNLMISAQDENIYHGIGYTNGWKHLTRDLIIDMQKGWALQDKPKRKTVRTKFRVSSIILSGSGRVDNLTVSSSEHMSQFYSAADWLVRKQDENGGWAIPVKRKIASSFQELKPGWLSAMSQGHGISVLARAFYRSGDNRYLEAAIKALTPFTLASARGGVVTKFMDKYTWYEEYPTKPSSFVLNGFIYALLGLYDLHTIATQKHSQANTLFTNGMESLKKLLPLYDMGTGSVYDLRHYTLGVTPNVARWDYHATHVNQLYLLSGLDNSPILINTAKRWEGYMQGKRAPHN